MRLSASPLPSRISSRQSPGLSVGSAMVAGAGRQRQRLVAAVVQAQLRDVLVQARILLRQHRHVAALDDHRMQARHGPRLGIRPDGDQADRTLAAARHVVERVAALDANEIIVAGHQRAGAGGHVAAAARLEGARQYIELVSRARVLVQVQRDRRLAVGVGLCIGQLLVVAVLGALRVVEAPALPAGEFRKGGTQHQAGLDAPVLCRRAEQVLGADQRRQPVGLHPTLVHLSRQPRLHAHGVGLELANLHAGGADAGALVVLADQVQLRFPGTAGRAIGRRVVKGFETDFAQRQSLPARDRTARVGQHQLQRQALQWPRPVGRAHDQPQVHGVAGPVQPTVGEHRRLQRTGLDLVGLATDVEARVVQRAAVAVHRQERQVLALLDGQHHRLLLAPEVLERGQRREPAGIGDHRDQGFAIAGDGAHPRARHRRAGGDRLHEHVATAVQRLLGQHAQVGQHHQAMVGLLAGVFGQGLRCGLGGVVGLELVQGQQEHATLAVNQVFAQVDAFVMGFRRIGVGELQPGFLALDQAVLGQAVEVGLAIVACVVLHQLVQRAGQHAGDFHAQAGDVARGDAHPAFAAQRQQRTFAQKAQQLGVRRHLLDLRRGLAQQEPAKRLQPSVHAHVQPAVRRCGILEAMGFGEFALGRCRVQVNGLRLFQHRLADFRP